MTLGDKLSKLRKSKNYTQEQLGELLGVSRQAISKWESDIAYPEVSKLIQISELYDCSIDYLVKDSDNANEKSEIPDSKSITLNLNKISYEKKSKKRLFKLPLWHIGKNATGIIAIGLNAKGVIAIGAKARGLISFGLLPIGLISVGLLPLGIISAGLLSLGLVSVGSFSFGLFSAGAISFGIISFGAVAVGDFSFGALAIGRYFAIGDNARAMIALGETKAVGSIYQAIIGNLTGQEIDSVKSLIDDCVPRYLLFAKAIIKSFI